MKVNMTPNPLDVVTIHASQGDTEARQWEFELHNNGELIDTSDITEQLFFKAYKGGTEQILPENTSTPTTSPFKGDIRYPQGLLTDQEFIYRQSPIESDGLAKITDIKGNTLVWNQLVQNGNFADGTNNWTATGSSTISASNGELTVTVGGAWNNDARQNVSVLVGHKYLGTFKVKSDTLTNIGISLAQFGAETNAMFATTDTLSPTYQTITGITTVTESASVIRSTLISNGSSYIGQTYTIKDVMLFDLTQMFGSGNEPTTVEQFTSLFSLPYYSYNQGTLLSFNGNGIKTVGKNQIANIVKGYFNAQSSTITVNGGGESFVFYALQGKTYYASSSITLNRNVIAQCDTPNLVNGSPIYNPVNFGNGTETKWTATWTGWTVWYVYNASNDNVENSAQVEIGTSASSYEPYTSSTLSLPISTYFSNGMKSAGSVYDELTPSKAITRLNEYICTGTDQNSWSLVNHYGSYTRFDNTSVVAKVSTQNFISNQFPSITIGTGNEGISFHGDDGHLILQILTSKLSVDNAIGLMNYFSSNNFQVAYEIATPTETSFTTASLVTENGEIPLSNEDGVLIGKCTEQLSSESGFFDAKIKLTDEDGECYSNKIQLHIERSPQ